MVYCRVRYMVEENGKINKDEDHSLPEIVMDTYF